LATMTSGDLAMRIALIVNWARPLTPFSCKLSANGLFHHLHRLFTRRFIVVS
jgi:hypothetical protein